MDSLQLANINWTVPTHDLGFKPVMSVEVPVPPNKTRNVVGLVGILRKKLQKYINCYLTLESVESNP